MSCFHPIYGYYVPGLETENGKQKYFVRTHRSLDFESNPIYQVKELPCGKCEGCKLDYAKQWAVRCVAEASLHKHNYFVTLTYDDEHIHKVLYNKHGNMLVLNTLRKSDLTAFNKVLRQHWKRKYNHDGIKFYGCGEYGENTYRPHMHVIYFNLPLDDLKFYKFTKDHKPLYISPTLTKLWKKGHVVIGEVNIKTCNYVARYVQKKQVHQITKGVDDFGIEEEFTLCSRRPGIGLNYYKDNKEHIYLTDEIHINGNVYKPPHYFDKKLEEENPILLADIKNTREVSRSIDELQNGKFNRKAYKLKCELSKKKKIKTLKRSNIPIDNRLDICYNKIIERS